ncbi:MAG: hypothetical protein A2157_18435 [Deltaproteobacteria bacterium RBG_16_47_11]|nr:MAG: hypothetical protein A2157_18435 [Deltaproteobacteria bacterium RBG_16_47_11]
MSQQKSWDAVLEKKRTKEIRKSTFLFIIINDLSSKVYRKIFWLRGIFRVQQNWLVKYPAAELRGI